MKINIVRKFLALFIVIASADLVYAQQIPFEQVLELAKQGNADAQNAIGLDYFSGKKGAGKAAEAFSWFEKAAKQNHPAALFNLATLYLNGQGTSKDPVKAEELLRKAADAGNPEALYHVGTIYQAKSEFTEAAKYIKSSAEKGNLEAQNRLGFFYSNGLGIPKDDKIAHEWYAKAANAGFAKAQHNMGEDYYFGTGVEKNLATAKSWYKKAADNGFADSKMKLAAWSHVDNKKDEEVKFLTGKSKAVSKKGQDMLDAGSNEVDSKAPKDPNKAFAYYLENAKSGDRDAQYHLGMAYLKMGNEAEGVKWIESAASLGQPNATRLTQLNSNYHQSNAYIDKLNQQKRKEFVQQRRNREDLYHSLKNKGY